MALEIIVTREDANSDSALLVEWLVADREQVRRGQPVCVIETSKSAIEIESPGEGTLCHLAAAGEEVELGGAIAAVAADEKEAGGIEAKPRKVVQPQDRGRVTRKAAELAARHDIDLTELETTGFVTVGDVEALIAEREGTAGTGGRPGLLAGISLTGISLPDVYAQDDGSVGKLDQGFLDSLHADPARFAALSSDEKCAAYREHGARIGEGVSFGDGALVIAPRIVLEDGVELGDRASVRCDEVFAVGALTFFGNDLVVSLRRVFIGRGGWLGRGIEIGGGGAHDPQAVLVLGDLAFVGDEAFVNPCRPVVVGAEVFITMRSVLVTHNIGHSLLEGFENRFAPIVLEDRVQVGIGAVVYAGCRIGAETIVASNSYVVTDMPAGKLAIGVPARVAGNAHRQLPPTRVRELAETMVEELHDHLALRGRDVSRLDGGEGRGFSIEVEEGAGAAQVLFVERLDASFSPSGGGETVVLTLGLTGEPPDGVAVLDLLGRRVHGPGGVVLDSVREFCRKRGIRFEPGPWRHRGVLL